MRRELEGVNIARPGDSRITYRIGDVVTITAIDHRADGYRSHAPICPERPWSQ